MWAPKSPQVTLQPTDGMSKGQIINNFNWRILKHQPLTYVEVVANDILYSFSPVRGDGPEKYPTAYHDFHTYFPSGKGEEATLRAFSHASPRVQPALAGFLTGYGHDFWVPGPVLAAGLVVGLAGIAGLGRGRRSRLRAPCLLFSLGTIFIVLPPFIIATFDWRYELPQFSLIPIAAVLAVTALAGWDRDRAPSTAPARPARRPPNGSQRHSHIPPRRSARTALLQLGHRRRSTAPGRVSSQPVFGAWMPSRSVQRIDMKTPACSQICWPAGCPRP